MKQYKDLLQDIKDNGEWKSPAREGMPRTKSIFSRSLRFDLTKGFPAVTIKKLYWKGVVGELIWFLRGDTNIKYLVDNGIHIWDADAYKYDIKTLGFDGNMEEYLNKVKNQDLWFGNCGHIYGHQWRFFNWHKYTDKQTFERKVNLGFDQIQYLVENIQKNPDSRYNRVTAWNPTDFIQNPESAALPACHTDFQVYIREGKYLDLDMNQRSCDTFLGVPFNIASYALLTHILAMLTGYQAGELIWNGKDIHYYENHQEQVDEILTREPYELPNLLFRDTFHYKVDMFRNGLISLQKFLEELDIEEFKLDEYESHAALKAPLSVGI